MNIINNVIFLFRKHFGGIVKHDAFVTGKPPMTFDVTRFLHFMEGSIWLSENIVLFCQYVHEKR